MKPRVLSTCIVNNGIFIVNITDVYHEFTIYCRNTGVKHSDSGMTLIVLRKQKVFKITIFFFDFSKPLKIKQ